MNYDFFENNIDLSFSLKKELRKTLTIKVLQDGSLLVKCPLFVRLEEVKKFIAKHVKWIQNKREVISENNRKTNEDVFWYIGEKYRLVVEHGLRDEIKLENEKLTVYATRPKNQNQIKKIIEKWYLNQASVVFSERIQHCLKNFIDLKAPNLIIKNMKSRWGSYSSKHKVTLNLKLIKAPIKCIDYVITHELCHAYHMNHGKEFKMLLESKVPNWKKVKKELALYMI